MKAAAVRGFKFAPMLVAVVLTVLGLRLLQATADVFLLLFLGVLISLYLGAVADWFERRLRLPAKAAFTVTIFASIGGLALLFWILIPPVVGQTQGLIKALPGYVDVWESGLDKLVTRFPALGSILPPGANPVLQAISDKVTGLFTNAVSQVPAIVHGAIDIFAVGVMGIYLAVHPELYREWLIALFPPIHRDLVGDLLTDLGTTLRGWLVGQTLTMAFLGAFTAVGLWVLDVPFALSFGIFTGLVAIVPFFGTLLSTAIPALFVLNGPSYHGLGSGTHALMVVGLGVVVHLLEGNIVSPLVMSKKIDLPPVLTIMAVLVMGQLLGGLGLIVALPTLAAVMVIVRRILINRIYEGQGFRKIARKPGMGPWAPPSVGDVPQEGPPADS